MILDTIVAYKRTELAQRCAQVPLAQLESAAAAAAPCRSLSAALRADMPGPRIIAEVKKASPSRGVIREDFDPATIARSYARNGAAALSVLTDEHFFLGSTDCLRTVRGLVDVPVLRKDFVFDHYQLVETRAIGADAVLLIVAVLGEALIGRMLETVRELGLEALVEVHTRHELNVATAAGADIIGINNRDLQTFTTSLDTTLALAAAVPEGTVLVSESGINDSADVARLQQAGVDAFLIGEAFMRAPDPGAALAALLNTERSTGDTVS